MANAFALWEALNEGCGLISLSFALRQDIQSQTFAFAMDFGVILRQLLQEVQDLRAENQRLIARIEALEALHELLDCTPDNGQIVKQWYLRQPPLRTEPEICN